MLVDFLEKHLFACTIKSLFGFDCPGCGMQRALIALLKGDVKASLELNASLLPFIFTILYSLSHLLFGFKNGAKMIVVFLTSTLAILIVNFVAKLILHA